MKKKVLLVIGLYLCSMTVLAAAKDMSWSGWVSDSKCGVKGANAEHAACAKKCIAAGEKPVLVTDKDQKVVSIDNPDALARHERHAALSSAKATTKRPADDDALWDADEPRHCGRGSYCCRQLVAHAKPQGSFC